MTEQLEKMTIKQTQPKSIQDFTPYELSQIDAWQDRNMGFEDDDEDIDNDYFWED